MFSRIIGKKKSEAPEFGSGASRNELNFFDG
jgi:hypothetical protein